MNLQRLLLPLVLAATATDARAQYVAPDQLSPTGTAYLGVQSPTIVWQAQVRAGLTGVLEGFTIRMSAVRPCTARVALRAGGGWNTSPAVIERTVSSPGAGDHDVYVDVAGANFAVVSGSLFVIEIRGEGTFGFVNGTHVDPPGSPQYGEPLFLNGSSCYADCGWRIAFRTFVRVGAGAPFCSGDGSGTDCPCGNNSSAGRGCGNSLGAGARLSATGATSVSSDSLVLALAPVPNTSVLFFQGTTQLAGGAGVVFGDGLRCAGGTVTRLGTTTATGHSAQYPGTSDVSIAVQGAIPSAGGVRTYQAWYRNAADYCTSATFNLSNGWGVAWLP